jgi:LruC domain-containing protein
MAICVPKEWKWSKERVSIVNSYKAFGAYASDMNVNRDWYLYPEEGKVIGF